MSTCACVLSKNGERLMPTIRLGKVRHLLKYTRRIHAGSCEMASWNSTPHHRQPCDIGSDAGYQDR